MTSARLRPWIALLLPLMLLRAMLPPGFMPVATDGGLQIVMCSAGLPAQADNGAADDKHPGLPDAGSCLFSHAPPSAPPSAAPCCGIAAPPPGFAPPLVAQRPLPTGPPRLASARGPPRHS